MPLTDLPPGTWTGLLVGHQWPHIASIAAVQSASAQRHRSGDAADSYADMLRSVQWGNLAVQEGMTAESNRARFSRGEETSRKIATKLRLKGHSYDQAASSVESLREALSAIAAAGNAAIDEVMNSSAKAETKVSAIVRIVAQANSDADMKAADCAGTIFAAVQSILDTEDAATSARAFAAGHGIDVGRFGGVNSLDTLTHQVAGKLDELNPPAVSTPAGATSPAVGNPTPALVPGPSSPVVSGPVDDTAISNAIAEGTPGSAPLTPALSVPENPSPAQPLPRGTADDPAPIGTVQQTVQQTSSGTQPAVGPAPATPAESAQISSVSYGSSTPDSSTAFPAQRDSPSPIALDSDNNNSGSKLSAGIESFTVANLINAAEPVGIAASVTPPGSVPDPITTATSDTLGSGGTPQPFLAPIATPNVAPPVTPTVIAPTAINPVAAPSSITPHGPLLAYGSDARPSMSTPPPAAAMTPAVPTSAPVCPSATTSQQGLIRQPTTVIGAAPSPSSAGLTERAVAAKTTGAATGVTAARCTATERLRRLLNAVVRQRPELGWAIGDLEEGTTILVTDLASGWIPPGMEIPAGVSLLQPANRCNDLAAPLRAATITATYDPSARPAANLEDAEPVPMSARARSVPPIDDLGWELSQATKWRDGLPRLAHTLARAACAKTGFLDSEVHLLHEHLRTVSDAVLNGYPDATDSTQVGNWQLLATIAALVDGETTTAHYHFAWFRSETAEERR